MKDKVLNLDQNLSNIFGTTAVAPPAVVYDVEEESSTKVVVQSEPVKSYDVDDEFEDIRNSMKRISTIGHDMLEEISAVARESEDHKVYDTAANVLSKLQEVELSRLDAYHKRNKAKGIDTSKKENTQQIITQTNNTVFVGTTSQLFDESPDLIDVN